MSGAAGSRVKKVTGLPSGQRLVWPLQILTNSVIVTAATALDLLETKATSFAAATAAELRIELRTISAIGRAC
jgi:hypothetical protein